VVVDTGDTYLAEEVVDRGEGKEEAPDCIQHTVPDSLVVAGVVVHVVVEDNGLQFVVVEDNWGVAVRMVVEPSWAAGMAGQGEADLEVLAGLDTDDVLVEAENALPASWILVDFEKMLISQNELQ
jgi:hypothetical protein